MTELTDDWTILNLPAIALEDERVQVGPGRWHERSRGDLLQPDREPREALESMRQQLGSTAFSAQYLQSPVPPEGNLIKQAWIKRYTEPPRSAWQVVQSWDTGLKPGEGRDYSVCTTWALDRSNPTYPKLYLRDVFRERLDFPALKHAVKRLIARDRPQTVLMEDAGHGTALYQELAREGLPIVPLRPEGDKLTRMSVGAAAIEAGQLFLPQAAPWLVAFEAELFAFPQGRHDDQVDTLSQLLAWIRTYPVYPDLGRPAELRLLMMAGVDTSGSLFSRGPSLLEPTHFPDHHHRELPG